MEVKSESAFKQYMVNHPEALQTLFKIVVSLYTDPIKVSEVKE